MRIKWFSSIRVVGLLLVLLYHFFLPIFPGGFVGVDIFFTLSGFLITALFMDEYTRKGTIDVISFFRRRLYRILPALVLMILIVTPLALSVRNDFIASIASQIAASLGFMTNIFEILAGNGYENQFTPHLFVHTWTLALEIQYYIFWVLAIWGMTKISKSIGQLRGMIFLSSSALFLLSFLSMFISAFFVDSFSTIYFSPLTHSFPFFLGSILATLSGISYPSKSFERLSHQLPIKKTLLIMGGGVSILLVLLFILPFNSIWTYTIGLFTATIAAGVLVYTARLLHEQTPHLHEPVIVTTLSDISYGIYLFHWPLYLIFGQLVSNLPAVLLTAFFSTLFSALSYYIIEPFLAGKPIRLLQFELDLKPYSKWIGGVFSLLALATLVICWTAPKVGSFEREMLISNLQQADTQMAATRSAAESAQASDYNIQPGVTIFGDSVTVRASSAIQTALPDAQIDGTVSRHLTEISNLIKLYKDSNTLRENVVVALGTNASEEYKELLDTLIQEFPKGHRLIFVTPYDGNFNVKEDSLAYQTGQYEKKLATENDYIIIADWFQVAVDNPTIWEDTDLVHFNLESNGAELFANNLKTAIDSAASIPVKK